MNFKKLYKQTNDNIHGDRKLIDAIYEKADSKIQFNIHAVSLCVASLLVVISLSVLPKFYGGEVTDNTSDLEQGRKITYKDTENITYDLTKESIDESEKTSPENEMTMSTPAISATNADDNLQSTKPNTQDEAAFYEQHNKNTNPKIEADKDTATTPYENTPNTEAENSTAENAYIKQRASEGNTSSAHSASAGGGSGGGSAASGFSLSTDEETTTEYMSVPAYEDYLGIDLNGLFSQLPQGMEMKLPDSISLIKDSKNGNYTDDSYTFVALDEAVPSRFLGITITKLDSKFKENFESYEKTMINGCEIAIIRNDSSNSAYFQHKGVLISIISFDVSNEDFDSFIKNITNNL